MTGPLYLIGSDSIFRIGSSCKEGMYMEAASLYVCLGMFVIGRRLCERPKANAAIFCISRTRVGSELTDGVSTICPNMSSEFVCCS